jgi:hypothetical protein
MPKITGFFDLFHEIDKIPPENISYWLKGKIEIHKLENFVANRIQYPQTIPLNKEEMEVDFALFREMVKLNSSLFYDPKQNTITLSDDLIFRFPPLQKLVLSIMDVVILKQLTQVLIKKDKKLTSVGSILCPILEEGKSTLKISYENINVELKVGTVNVVPLPQSQIDMKVGERNLKVFGGTLGVLIDLRVKS